MNSNELRDYAKKQPFVPFRIILTTGESLEIPHPDLIMVGARSAMVGFPEPGSPTLYQRATRVDLLHIVWVEELPTAAPVSSNGQKS